MRKDARQDVTLDRGNTIQAYHNRNFRDDGSYASGGFGGRGFLYWTSDRPKPAETVEMPKGYGIEWETVSSINHQAAMVFCLSKMIEQLFTSDFVKFQNDGSLGGNSNAEMITGIMTKAFIRNSYMKWKAFYQFCNEIDTLPDDSCGMHINISIANFGKTRDEQLKNIMKLHNFINGNFELACKLLKRNIERTTYCSRMRLDNIGFGHYCSINYAHVEEETKTARLELRLVGPQRTFASFRNTLEVVFWLVKQSKELSAKDWNDPVKLWSGCNQYVMQRLQGFLGEEIESAIRANVKREELV